MTDIVQSGLVPLLDEQTGRFPDEFAPPSVAADAVAARDAAEAAGRAQEAAEAAENNAAEHEREAGQIVEDATATIPGLISEQVTAQIDPKVAAATQAKTDAETARGAAQTARDDALQAKAQAVAAQEAAAGSAGAAATSAGAAADSAGSASGAATNAEQSMHTAVNAADAVGAVGGSAIITASAMPEYARNRMPNPQLKGLSGVTTPGVSVSAITSGLPELFSYGMESTSSGVSTAMSVSYAGASSPASPYSVPVSPGETISIGAFVWAQLPPSSTGLLTRLRARFCDAAGVYLSSVDKYAMYDHAAETWTWVQATNIVVPAGAAVVQVETIINSLGVSANAGYKARITGIAVFAGSMMPGYGDGSRHLWAWTASAHASPSVRIARTSAEDAAIDVAIQGNSLPPAIQVQVAGNSVTVTEQVDGKSLVTTLGKVSNANGGFRLDSVQFGGVRVQTVNDDITPIRCNMGTVGANHGFATAIGIFDNPDGKTVADIGSTWTDGSREYVILALTSTGRLKIGGSYTGSPVTSVMTQPAANLTHVTGASHTAPIIASSCMVGSTASSDYQLTPGSVTRQRLSLWMDGIELTTDGTYYGAAFEVREAYEIVDYASLYDTAKANPGTLITALTVDGAVLVQNTFTWRGGGRVDVLHTLDELMPTELKSCGAIQAMPLALDGHTTWRYVPGMGTVGGIDWSLGVDLTSYAASNILPASSLRLPGRVPAFHLDTLVSGGTTKLGFASGYVPFRATSYARSSRRLTASAQQLWDMRNTKKAYPTWTISEAPGWGHVEVAAYRCYLSPAQVATVLDRKTDALSAYAALAAATGLPIS